MTLAIARDEQGLVAILHHTIIVRETPLALTISTGGFRTRATLRALQQVGQETEHMFVIITDKGEWFVQPDKHEPLRLNYNSPTTIVYRRERSGPLLVASSGGFVQ